MQKLVVLSGAGMSAESGLKTFRDMGGLWEQYQVTEVASPKAWELNRSLVLKFYNERRQQLFKAEPNPGHYGLVKLEHRFEVHIITQNVDDLHERAGSRQVLHLHGELKKARSTIDPNLVYDLTNWELKEGDLCEKGSQLRPHIVWFGEPVPAIREAIELVQQADVFVVAGTSLSVYPAAALLEFVSATTPIYLIDPGHPNFSPTPNIHFINEKASSGVQRLLKLLMT
jgi:NAD-dependent deacetylase